MEIDTLFSSSAGNCIFVRTKNHSFLIDAGSSFKRIRTALSELSADLSDLSAIFVTHEHSDHISALPMIEKHFPVDVYLPPNCLWALEKKIDPARLHPLPPFEELIWDDFSITSFPTPHDSRGSCGYILSCEGNRYGIATDMGYVTKDTLHALRGCLGVIVEANYNRQMLKNGPYPPDLQARVDGKLGHLENQDCAELCSYLAKNGTKHFLLAHLSAENNRPELAKKTVWDRLVADGYSEEQLSVSVADRFLITRLLGREENSLCSV
jgi:phosphoribosyl 1,2-cyclic phosphodiesterase